MARRARKGMAGVKGLAGAIDADIAHKKENSDGKESGAQSTDRVYRGLSRAPGSTLKTLSVTLPVEVVRNADLYVVERKQSVPSYNRSALIEEALRAFLAAHGQTA